MRAASSRRMGSITIDQAIKILDQRWQSTAAPEFDSGEEATKLYTMPWPVECSADAYNSLFNRAISAATRINMNPRSDSNADIALRATWWHVIAKPPASSPYYPAAQQARAITRQECTTVAHRNEWHAAMIKEITTMVQAGATMPTGARGVAARSASAHPVTDSPGDASWHALHGQVGSPPPPGLGYLDTEGINALAAMASQPLPFAGGGARGGGPALKPCGKCPALPNGGRVFHPRGYGRCMALAKCTECNSDFHLAHSCYIANGVPSDFRGGNAESIAEIARLHVIHKAGKFDWRTTPTKLGWLDRMQKGITTVPVSFADAGCDVDDFEEELRYVASFGCAAEIPEAPTLATVAPGRMATVASAPPPPVVSGSGLSDVYSSMVAFDGAGVGMRMASAAQCAPCADGHVERITERRPHLSYSSLMDDSRGAVLSAPDAGHASDVDDDEPRVRVLGLPTMFRLVMWGLFLLMVMVPVCTWFVRTNHDLVDAAASVLVQWSPRFYAAAFMVWQWVVHLHSGAMASAPLLLAGMGVAGAFVGDGVLGIVEAARDDVVTVVSRVQAVVRSVRAAPRVPWVALALLGVFLHVASPSPLPCLAAPSVRGLLPPSAGLMGGPRLSAPLPSVVRCNYSARALRGEYDVMRGRSGGEAGWQLMHDSSAGAWPASVVPAVAGTRVAGMPDVARALIAGWAPKLDFGEWIVDSGAELMIAGAFIYPYATVIMQRPDVQIQSVDGSMTQVDAVVRTMVQMEDATHKVCEVLVCDSFGIALWSTEYMGCFGFSALLLDSASTSVVCTPSGHRAPLKHRPYRLLAPPRAPTVEELASPSTSTPLGNCTSACTAVNASLQDASPSLGSSTSTSLSLSGCGECDEQVSGLTAGATTKASGDAATPPRLVSEAEAWLLHSEFMHAGWNTIAKTCNVRIPTMPKCPICQVTKSKRTPQPGHETVSTFAGQLTHSDTWGPFRSALYYKGCRYVVAFVDDYSKVKLAVFCKDRTAATLVEAYKIWHAFMASMGCPPTGVWLSDGGPEYVSNEAFDFCDEHALQRLLSVRYTPTQNGSAEAVFLVHVPRARAAIRACAGEPELYALAIQYSLWLNNRSWHKKLGCTPFDMVPHPPPLHLHHRKPFGCRLWAHQPDVDVPHKMADTARAGVFCGMSELYKGVIAYYPETHEFEAASHVKYDPGCMPMRDMGPSPPPRTPLPDPTPLPPLFVPSTEPLVAPTIPTIPPPQGLPQVNPIPVQATPPRHSVAAQRPAQAGLPRFTFSDGDDADAHGMPAMPPVPVVDALRPVPLLAPPDPLLAPRRPGSMAAANLRHPELQRAAGTRVPGSLAVVVAWLVSTSPSASVAAMAASLDANESTHTAVVIFSGYQSAFPSALRSRGARVVEIDIAIGGRFHDLTDVTPNAIGWHLRRAAQRGEIQSVHAAVPCETFSVGLHDADMVRDDEHQMGLARLTLPRANKLCTSNALLFFTVDLCTDVFRAGGECTIENPSPRSDTSLPHVFWPAKAHHANLFRTGPMLAYAAATGSTEITTPLCACGMDMQKYVTVLATKKAARVLKPLHGLVCLHDTHKEKAYGVTSTGKPGGLESARYPLIFSVVLACAHLGLAPPGIDVSQGSPLVVPAARAAVQTLTYGSRHVPAGECFAAPQRTSAISALVSTPMVNYTSSHTAANAALMTLHTDNAGEFASVGTLPRAGMGSCMDGQCLRAASQYYRVRAPGYVEPTGPGWWPDADGDESDGDESDAGDDEYCVLAGGMSTAFKACIKGNATAYKASARTRYSTGPDGSSLRHDIPRGYDEAARHTEAAGLWEAMIREMNAHEDCQTWTVRPATECYAEGKTPIDCMWVYDCKVDATTEKFLLWKARLVGRGDQMVYLRDYLDTYSGVVRHATFRTFLAACAQLGLVVTGADVSTAYLHAPLRDFVVWMKPPRGFPADFEGAPGLCRLNMALYGLKQSAREWAITLIEWLTDWGFVQCTSDRYMFKYTGKLGVLIMLIWVDDIFMGHDNDAIRKVFMEAFKARFRVKDLGRLCQALGASVSQSLSEGWVSFSLEKYIGDLARRFELHENVAWADIPVPVQLAKDCRDASPDDTEVAASIELYGVLTGSVVFIATFARPDVAYAAHLLSTFLVRPGRTHLKLARRVLGYLSRTRDLAITYRKGAGDFGVSFSPQDLGESGAADTTGVPHMLVDTDHGIKRSVTGWVFMFAGAAISWAVRGQTMPSLSSAEAELYGLSTGVCDALTTTQVLEEMGFVLATITIATDSRGARLLAMDCAAAARTRHIHRRWYFVRYHVDEGHVNVVLVKGSLNRSNFMTKPVGGASFAADRAYAMGILDAALAAA